MTKRKTYRYPDPIPGFDVLQWKQENQARIYQTIKDMTSEEYIEYVRKSSAEFREEQKRFRAAEKQT
jgi:DNA-binding PadR family transcriptional regulator